MSYTDIYSNNPNGLSMGMPTVDPGAAMSNLGAVNTGGVTAPTGSAAGATVAPPVTGGVAGAPQQGSGPGFFSEFGPAQFALGAIQTLGSLWNSFQQNKLAKESFNFQKDAFETNLANQEQSYNTELEDRINARYVTEGRTDVAGDTAKYVEENKL